MMTMNKERLQFIWRITSVHMTAYFIAGIAALAFMNYREHYGSAILSQIMRPVDSPWVALGAGLQILRGFIISLVLLPLKDVFIKDNGWRKLAVIIFGLSYISTIGPTFGSFDGYIYTSIPIEYHLLGIPEAVLYIFLFSFLIGAWYKHPGRSWTIVSVVSVILIELMSAMGYLASIGVIQQ